MQGVIPSRELMDQIKKAVASYFRNNQNLVTPLQKGVAKPPRQQRMLVVLDEALLRATDYETGYTTATASIWARKSDGTLYDTGDNITVTNRFTGISIDAGVLTKVEWIGEWQPYAADCV